MSFELPQLPYSYDSLEPLGMSKETLEFHHDLHHNDVEDKMVEQFENMGDFTSRGSL